MGSGEREKRGNEARYGLVWRKLRGREGQALERNTGPAWEVDMFVGDAPCLAGLGQAGLLEVMRDVITNVGSAPPGT